MMRLRPPSNPPGESRPDCREKAARSRMALNILEWALNILFAWGWINETDPSFPCRFQLLKWAIFSSIYGWYLRLHTNSRYIPYVLILDLREKSELSNHTVIWQMTHTGSYCSWSKSCFFFFFFSFSFLVRTKWPPEAHKLWIFFSSLLWA